MRVSCMPRMTFVYSTSLEHRTTTTRRRLPLVCSRPLLVSRRSSAAAAALSSSSSSDDEPDSSSSADLIEQGIVKYNELDRTSAINLFEQASEPRNRPSPKQLQTALLGATCSHAYFGDIELAKVTLRAAVEAGLDYESAMADPACPFKLEASSQARVQLRDIARKAAAALDTTASTSKGKAASSASALPPLQRGGGMPAAAAGASKMTLPPLDLNAKPRGAAPPGLETVEIKGMDTTPLGVVKRVAGLIVVGVIGFAVLFGIGLATFPQFN